MAKRARPNFNDQCHRRYAGSPSALWHIRTLVRGFLITRGRTETAHQSVVWCIFRGGGSNSTGRIIFIPDGSLVPRLLQGTICSARCGEQNSLGFGFVKAVVLSRTAGYAITSRLALGPQLTKAPGTRCSLVWAHATNSILPSEML